MSGVTELVPESCECQLFHGITFGVGTMSLCTLRPVEKWLNVTQIYTLHKIWQLGYNVGKQST